MSAIKFANSKWSVGAMDNNGRVDSPHNVPWQFNDTSMNAGNLWYGGWKVVNETTIKCEIIGAGGVAPMDSFEVVFLNEKFFIATKDHNLYRFGRRIE